MDKENIEETVDATNEQIEQSLDSLDKLLNTIQLPNDTENKDIKLSDLTVFDDQPEFKPQVFTTDLIEHIQQLEPSLTVEQVKELIDYVKGISKGRPEFLDKMLTQTNDKLVEAVKLMSILQLTTLPKLFDYQKTLMENLTNPEALKGLTYDELARTLASVNKAIGDSLQLGLRVATQMPVTNTTPTKVEKLANALMNVPESTRDRIEEIISSEMI